MVSSDPIAPMREMRMALGRTLAGAIEMELGLVPK